MENNELNNIGKKIAVMKCDSKNSVENLIKLIDEMYIILDELNHVNYFNVRLSHIKSSLASVDCHLQEEKNIFNTAKDELLEVLEESHTLI